MSKRKKTHRPPLATSHSPLALSQCMIVKNEEKNIEHALSWAKGVAFEQIVVDTGSTDRTVEIAERMGAKVFHFKWIDDFSAAKNYAIDQASGDWIAFLDADEYMSADHARMIIPLIQKNIKLYGNQFIALHSKWAHLRNDGSIFQIDRQQRIFINHPDVRYERPIHETLKVPAGTGPITENDILILHTGYSQNAFTDTRKIERNIAILKKMLESDPEDVKSKYYLANDFCLSGKFEEALPLFREILDKTARKKNDYEWFRARTFNHMIARLSKDTETCGEAFVLAEQAFREFPHYLDFCRLYGLALYQQKQFENALNVFKKAEKLVKDGKIENQELAYIDELYKYLMQTYLKLNNLAKALHYAVVYLKSHKHHEDTLKICLWILRSKDSLEKRNPEDALEFLSKIYDFKNTSDKTALLRCARDLGDIALAQLLVAGE